MVFARRSPSAQLLVEETAEDVAALAYGPADPLHEQEPARSKSNKLSPQTGTLIHQGQLEERPDGQLT